MARPRDPEEPCPVCGASVEPLRAPEVVLLDAGPQFLCSAACRGRFLLGLSARPPQSASESSRRILARTRPSARPAAAASGTGGHVAIAAPPVPAPALGVALAASGILTAPFALGERMAAITLVLGAAGALVACVSGSQLRTTRGWLAWLSTPVAALLGLVGAGLGVLALEDARLELAAACVVAAAANVRWWLDALADGPVLVRGARSRARMPTRARPAGLDPQRPLDALPETDVERLRVGEEVVAREGDVAPVDGVVRAGEAEVRAHPSAQASVRRGPGDSVLAGARITRGALRILATHVGTDRALVRPLRFGDASAADAAGVTRLAGRVLGLGTVLVLCALGLGLLLGAPGESLAPRLLSAGAALAALPLLALRRASSEPWIAAGLAAAERGIALASARALDRAGRVSVAVLCTRGTMTEGTPEVVEIHGTGEASSETAALWAAAAEASLSDPGRVLGRALVRWASGKRGAPVTMRRVQAVPGRGLRALGPGGEPVLVGNRQLLLEDGVSIAALEEAAVAAEGRGHTVLWVAIDRRARAAIALRDEEHPGARAAVQRLIDLGVEAILLSGDQRATVAALARSLDVEHVKAELSPEERTTEVRRLRDAGSVVCVIGRAGADDEALAACDVPIVLGAAGGPAADRGAALAGDDVRDAAAVVWIAHATRREAVRGSILAGAGGATLGVLGALGLVDPGIIALAAVAIDAWVLPIAGRLLLRIDLRLPVRG